MIKSFAAVLLALCVASSVVNAIQAPYKVIYIDFRNVNWNNGAQTVLDAVDAGFNVVILAFYLSGSGPADMATVWAALPDATKVETMNQVHAKGAVVLVAVGGATDSPYSSDAQRLGTIAGEWARSQHLDGVDFDLEDVAAGFTVGGKSTEETINWFVTVTDACKTALGSDGIITHAPQAPYFGAVGSSGWTGPSGGYTTIESRTSNIDFYNVQFYNQGLNCYTDYNGLFKSSCSNFPGTSVAEIHAAGIPLEKIVVGKPVTIGDAGNGYVEPAALGGHFRQAASELGWNAGIMGWQWGEKNTLTSWLNGILSSTTSVPETRTSTTGQCQC
jgi:chitinase